MKKIIVNTLDDLTPAMFFHSLDTGRIRAGIKWTTSTDGGQAECYQFATLEELVACAKAYQAMPDMLKFSIVTHSGQYKNMKTRFTWERAQ
jgi:hypothetical protein